MTHHSKQRMTALVCILVLALSLLAGCGAKKKAPAASTGELNGASAAPDWRDYNGKKIGVLVGPLMEDAAAEMRYAFDAQQPLSNRVELRIR